MSDSRFMTELRNAIEAKGTNSHAVSLRAFRSAGTVASWFTQGRTPRVDNYEAALNAVGRTIKIVSLEEKE